PGYRRPGKLRCAGFPWIAGAERRRDLRPPAYTPHGTGEADDDHGDHDGACWRWRNPIHPAGAAAAAGACNLRFAAALAGHPHHSEDQPELARRAGAASAWAGERLSRDD